MSAHPNDSLRACATALKLPSNSIELRNCADCVRLELARARGRLPARRELKRQLMASYRMKYFPPGLGGWLAWVAIRFVVSRIFDWLLQDMVSRGFKI